MELTSRERVRRAVAREPVDRLPIDFGVHFSTGISVFAYQNLREYLGLPCDRIEMIDCVQMLARVDGDVLDRFGVDTMLLNPPWPETYVWNPRGKYRFHVPMTFRPEPRPQGGYRVRTENGEMVMPEGGFFFDGDWPDFYGLSEDEWMKVYGRRAEQIHKETDKYTMLMGFSAYFGGLDFACDMLTDPEDCIAANERNLAGQLRRFDRINKAFGPYIDAIEINGDLGTQDGPMCTPSSYEQCCLPFVQRFCRHVHETSDIQIFMHCCGSVMKLMPMLSQSGLDALNPVQISARDMDPGRLKREYGDKVCFWGGGCDTQTVLWNKTPEEVAAHVHRMIEIFAPGSGYVFNQVHNIMGNVPPENIVAMYDTALQYKLTGK